LRTIYQGCRALPFALAGLSCSYFSPLVVICPTVDICQFATYCTFKQHLMPFLFNGSYGSDEPAIC